MTNVALTAFRMELQELFHVADVKVFFKCRMGPFPIHVRSDGVYLTFVHEEELYF